jgi:hypothetical protein
MGVKPDPSRFKYNDELHNLCFSPDNYSYYGEGIKEAELWKACSTHGREEKCIRVSVWTHDIKRPVGRLRVNGRTILRWIFEKLNRRMWSGSEERPMVDSCKHCYEPSGFITCKKFLHYQLRASQERLCSMGLIPFNPSEVGMHMKRRKMRWDMLFLPLVTCLCPHGVSFNLKLQIMCITVCVVWLSTLQFFKLCVVLTFVI